MSTPKLHKPVSYYILLPDEPDEYATYESNLLGEVDVMGTFWAGSGLHMLMRLVSENSQGLQYVRIKTDQNKSLTIEEFVNIIQRVKIKYDNL